MRVYSTPVDGNDVANKTYVDSKVGSANIPVLNGAPSGPAVGDMWFNTGDNGLYIRRS